MGGFREGSFRADLLGARFNGGHSLANFAAFLLSLPFLMVMHIVSSPKVGTGRAGTSACNNSR